jgi:hypothetical protein
MPNATRLAIVVTISISIGILSSNLAAQQDPPSSPPPPAATDSASPNPVIPAAPADQDPQSIIDKRILGVLPNYRTVQDTGDVPPIDAKGKITIALKDSFDYPIYLLSAAYAGLYQLDNENPSYGQGVKGYARRFGANFGDNAIGNMMTEGFMAAALHEDPRYYRQGPSYGGPWRRTFYALTRVLVQRTDSGRNYFNFAEVTGNAIAVGISNLYEPDTQTVGQNFEKLGIQIGTDAASNVIKEFWPDIKAKWKARRAKAGGGSESGSE